MERSFGHVRIEEEILEEALPSEEVTLARKLWYDIIASDAPITSSWKRTLPSRILWYF